MRDDNAAFCADRVSIWESRAFTICIVLSASLDTIWPVRESMAIVCAPCGSSIGSCHVGEDS